MGDFERSDPPFSASEKEMLTAYLDYHRATLLKKLEGLSREQLLQRHPPTTITLLGLLKHLAYVERYWFRQIFAGEDLPFIWTREDADADWRVEDDDTVEGLLEFYKNEVRQARIIAKAASLDDIGAIKKRGEISLRWIVLHMIEEVARHNGHADLIRESIDGQTGE